MGGGYRHRGARADGVIALSTRRIALLATAALFLVVMLFSLLQNAGEPSDHDLGLGPDRTADDVPNRSGVAAHNLTLTIIYDNNEFDDRLDTGWGFSCLVEGLEDTILFDTGADSPRLLSNMETLGIEPEDIDAVVISHVHQDHVGGLSGLLREHSDLRVYLPAHFPDSIKETVTGHGAELVEIDGPVEVCDHAYSTGELGTSIREQSLVIDTERGLVLIAGCAHPGIVNIVREAKRQLQGGVYLAIGGFHLHWSGSDRIEGIVRSMRDEGVEMVGPCHCSGDLARSVFETEYGDDFVRIGVGTVLGLG